MTVVLTGRQALWDTLGSWRRFEAGSRHVVVRIRPMATGRTDRQPFELSLQEVESGARLELEVADGDELVWATDHEDGTEGEATTPGGTSSPQSPAEQPEGPRTRR